uniref:Uncharacterized protein n=1 Tax=Rhizophora mucronata TaxID=61149 RepID=A0A2P2NQI4_RHIMU
MHSLNFDMSSCSSEDEDFVLSTLAVTIWKI